MKEKKPKTKGRGLWTALSIVFTVLFAFTMIGGPIANNYAQIINAVLDTESSKIVGDPSDAVNYESDFATSSEQTANGLAITKEIVASGAALLLNRDNVLPLNSGAKVTLIGSSAYHFIYGGTGSGGMDSSNAQNLKDALEADGFSVNPTLWDFYATGAGKDYVRKDASGSLNNYIFQNEEFAVNEAPLSVFSNAEWDSITNYGNAVIFVLGRSCGEGKDMPVTGAADAGGNLLSVSAEERAILKKLAELKTAGKVQKIVILINSSNAIELDILDPEVCGEDYGIDACMWIGEAGQNGIDAVGELLNGTINPSGRLTDTYCYDDTTSPAIQNAYVTSYTNAEAAGLAFKGTNNEYYVVYQEGIYVGYRYYETRYEDYVLGNANVGDYDYAKTVAFPFGYGLSYSEFTYENFSMTDAGDGFTFTVDVKNTSDRDGRHSVLIFMQSPYTQYDKENGVEKAAIELVGYTKVDVPANSAVTAAVSVAKSEMRAYDANGAKTYIVDAGNYYFSVGNGAHDALNNVLALKSRSGDTSNGTVDESRMTSAGNADFAAVYTVAEQDNTTYSMAVTGNPVTNQLDHADINKADSDASNDIVYLTRSDWAGTMPQATLTGGVYKAAVQLRASDELIAALKTIPGSDGQGTMPTFGKAGELSLAQFIGTPLDGTIDGGYTWDNLVDQVKLNEMARLLGQGHTGTAPLSSISKPNTKEADGPQGITTTLMGGGSSTSYTSEDTLAAAFDIELAERMGKSFGNDCLMANGKIYSGIYAPGVNIHRTPYSGRNFEYYSEDPFLSGKTCAAEVAGIQSKGVYVYMKHFAINDQETGRDGICVWTNEQAAREIYLQAFEYPVEEANAYCVMTSFNRLGTVWTGGDYNLLTNILRGEWGLAGHIVTDFADNNDYMDVIQGILAGGDLWLSNNASKWTQELLDNAQDPKVATAMREATKHILYTVANSNAMNGLSANMKIVEVTPWWKTAIIVADVAFGVLAAGSIFMLVRSFKKGKATS